MASQRMYLHSMVMQRTRTLPPLSLQRHTNSGKRWSISPMWAQTISPGLSIYTNIYKAHTNVYIFAVKTLPIVIPNLSLAKMNLLRFWVRLPMVVKSKIYRIQVRFSMSALSFNSRQKTNLPRTQIGYTIPNILHASLIKYHKNTKNIPPNKILHWLEWDVMFVNIIALDNYFCNWLLLLLYLLLNVSCIYLINFIYILYIRVIENFSIFDFLSCFTVDTWHFIHLK